MNRAQTSREQEFETTHDGWAKTARGLDVRWKVHKVLRGVKSIYGCVHWTYCVENSGLKALLVDFHQSLVTA